MSRSFQVVALSVALAAAMPGLSREARAAGILPSGSNFASASSWLAGAVAGYNWQRGSVVYGVETDLSATRLNSAMTGGLSLPFGFPLQPTDMASTSATIDWYGTVRGRFGVTTGSLLFYGTAGLAYGNVSLSSAFSTTGLSLNQQVSATRLGWVVGAGFEYLVRPDLSLTLGYQYVDLGNLGLAGGTGTFATIGQTAGAHASFQAVTAGFSWHFPPAGSAPWEGGYVGGRAGGAWGNDTNARYLSSLAL
jgi:outer membrane immunogenic protein